MGKNFNSNGFRTLFALLIMVKYWEHPGGVYILTKFHINRGMYQDVLICNTDSSGHPQFWKKSSPDDLQVNLLILQEC